MENWRTVKLKEVCKQVTVGFVGSMADEYCEEGVPFLRSLNIEPFKLNLENLKFIPLEFHEKIKKSTLRPGDVGIVRTGYPGTACVIPESLPESNCSDLVIVRPGSDLNPYYLAAIFNSAFGRSLVGGNLVGAAQQHFNVTVAKELKIHLPPKLTQDKIAAILSAYDDLIANNQRRIALLESMAEEIYREWFVRMRFPGHADAAFEKGHPVAWRESRLGDVATFTMGQSPSSEFYNDRQDGLPFHQGVGTYGPRFPRHEVYCSAPGRQALAGDILFSVRAPVGRLNIADVDLIVGRGLSAVRHRQGFNTYLFYLLRVAFAKEDVIGNGSIFNSVGKDELARFLIFAPDETTIKQFEQVVKPMDEQLKSLYETIDRLKATRDSLLPRLISGKLQVDQLDIQHPPGMKAEPAPAA